MAGVFFQRIWAVSLYNRTCDELYVALATELVKSSQRDLSLDIEG